LTVSIPNYTLGRQMRRRSPSRPASTQPGQSPHWPLTRFSNAARHWRA